MILVLSFFILLILFFVFGVIFSKIKINIKKFNFKMLKNELCENEFWVNIGLYLFGIIKIISINIKNNDIRFMGKKLAYETLKSTEVYKKLLKPDIKELDRKLLTENIKSLSIKFDKFNLDLSLGADSTLITSFLVFAVSTVISMIVRKGVTKYSPKKHRFIITPKYENFNLINVNLYCVISLKTSNLLKVASNTSKRNKEKKLSLKPKYV